MLQRDETIYLFSSSSRDQYIQDALNILALPSGAIYHFRYNLYSIRKSEGTTKLLTSFRKPLQMSIDMIFLTLLMVRFFLLDSNSDSNERWTLTRLSGVPKEKRWAKGICKNMYKSYFTSIYLIDSYLRFFIFCLFYVR